MPVAPVKYTKTIQTPVTDIQWSTLQVLKSRNVKIPQFIREAIKEKIDREAAELRVKPKKIICPF